MSPLGIRSPTDQVPAMASNASDQQHSRSDKSRLSLTFLKRGTANDHRGHASKVNGTPPQADEETASNPSNAASLSGRNKSRLSFLHGSNTGHSQSDELQRNNSVLSSDRQAGAVKSEVKSDRSGNSTLVDRVGSVRKRLSVLGIGKKASKASVKPRLEDDSLLEE